MNLNAKLFIVLILVSAGSYAQTPVTVDGIPKQMSWENKPLDFKVNGNNLIIRAGAKTDWFREPSGKNNTDNTPRLLFTPDNDFVLIAKIQHAFASKWDAGALVLKSDSLNWVKFAFEKDYTGAKRVVSVVTKNLSDDCNSVELTSSSVYFKMARSGNVVTLYYSSDGSAWFLVRHFPFTAGKNLKVGFLAQSPTGTENEVTFSEIKYVAKKIKDPYGGE